jgi:hypothetical protein
MQKIEACFDKLVFSGDEEPLACPGCGTRQVEKLMSCASLMDGGIGKACTSGAAVVFPERADLKATVGSQTGS